MVVHVEIGERVLGGGVVSPAPRVLLLYYSIAQFGRQIDLEFDKIAIYVLYISVFINTMFVEIF